MNCAEFRVAQTTGGREKEDQEEVRRGGKIDHNNDKTRWDECSGWHGVVCSMATQNSMEINKKRLKTFSPDGLFYIALHIY